MSDIEKLLADAAGSAKRAAGWAVTLNDGVRLRREDEENIAGVLTGNVICLESMAREIARLREAIEIEHGRALIAESERDAITRLLVVESLAKGDGWYVQEDLPPKVKGRYPTFDAAVAVVRKAAGLDAEDRP